MAVSEEYQKAIQQIDTLKAENARLKHALANSRAAMQTEWISVEEKTPHVELGVTDFKPCLVVNDGHVQWALFNGKTQRFQDAKYHDIHKQVSHWMPLPLPPDSETHATRAKE